MVNIIVCHHARAQSSGKLAPTVAGAKGNAAMEQLPAKKDYARTDEWLVQLLKAAGGKWDTLLNARKARNLQIIYSQVDRGSNGMPAIKHSYCNLDTAAYFYPSAAAGLVIAILTLQAVNELKATGIDLNTTMLTEKGYGSQTAVFNDPGSPGGKPSVGLYIKKLLTTGDPDAFNRLYELLGPQYINDQLKRKGYGSARIINRIGVELTEDENRHTNPIQFIGAGNQLLYDQSGQYFTGKLPQRNDSIGKAHFVNGKPVRRPKSFGSMNRISLEDLHSILISLVFPAKVPAVQRFGITDSDRRLLLKYMSQTPAESLYPPYMADSAFYPAGFKKYLLNGGAGALPAGVRIFNVAGRAYGQVTDVAYIVDFNKQIEFFLSAVIDCNRTGVLQQQDYEYNTLAMPMMQQLGIILYEYELRRTKKLLPDLSELQQL